MRIQFGITSNNNFTRIDKDDKGNERRYLIGTSSGALFTDAHNERMSERCIKGFQYQSLTKTIYLLHPHTEDLLSNHIGILLSDKSFIDENKEWKTTFRLWDDNDTQIGIPLSNIERSKDFWNQVTGQGIYKNQTAIRQLSVQGLVDESKDIKYEGLTRIIDWVDLDGVSAITKGAYPQDNFTVAQKIFKQLDTKKISKQIDIIKSKIEKSDNMEDFYLNEWKLEDKFNDAKNEILTNVSFTNEEKKDKLISLLDEYKAMSISNLELINYSLEGEPMKTKKNLDEKVDALTGNEEPEIINKEEGQEEPEQEGVSITPDILEELVERTVAKIVSKMKAEAESEHEEPDGDEAVMKESDDDGLMSGEPDVLKNKSKKEDDENMEKSDTEPVEKEDDENMEKEVDADIEKVAKKLKLSAKQKQDLYNQKEMNKLPKGIVKQLEKSSAKINELEKKIQILQAGQDAFVNAFSDDKPVINKVNKTFVKQTIDTTPDMKVNKQNPAKYNSFNSLRNILGGK
jgi:hypothetical protein